MYSKKSYSEIYEINLSLVNDFDSTINSTYAITRTISKNVPSSFNFVISNIISIYTQKKRFQATNESTRNNSPLNYAIISSFSLRSFTFRCNIVEHASKADLKFKILSRSKMEWKSRRQSCVRSKATLFLSPKERKEKEKLLNGKSTGTGSNVYWIACLSAGIRLLFIKTVNH